MSHAVIICGTAANCNLPADRFYTTFMQKKIGNYLDEYINIIQPCQENYTTILIIRFKLKLLICRAFESLSSYCHKHATSVIGSRETDISKLCFEEHLDGCHY